MAAPRSAPFYELFSSLAADRHFATDVFAKQPLLLEGPALDGVAGAITMDDIDAAVSAALLHKELDRLFTFLELQDPCPRYLHECSFNPVQIETSLYTLIKKSMEYARVI